MKKFVFGALALCALAFVSCKDDDDKKKEEVKVTIKEATLSLKVGETATLTVTPADAALTSNNAEVATVDAKGVVTAVAAGEAVITATKGDKKAECKVTVTAKGEETPEDPKDPNGAKSSIGNVDGVVPGGEVKEQEVYMSVSGNPEPTAQKINIEAGSFDAKGIVKVVLTSTADGSYWKEDGSAFAGREEDVPTFENVYVCPTTDMAANPWDNQFFIQCTEDGWAAGETHKVSYFIGTLQATPFVTEASDGSDSTYYKSIGAQCHTNVGDYKHWKGAGNGQCIVDGKWHKIDVDYTVDADADGMKTFAFNLNDPAPANIFFFTEISVE
ncbi:MAG: Ig-like domain-containing protein [Salinivirgaceae bacterium]|nr:Ig-like domain-containing protein [Salinivirgaceae bacterium]